MKFINFLSILALATTLVSSNPTPVLENASTLSPLDKRAGCIVLNGGKFFGGKCVDVRKAKQCDGGLLVTGWCGGGNTNICCIKGFYIGKAIPPRTGIGSP